MHEKIKLGISSCLLGEAVRYDGQHKLDRWLRDILGKYATYCPVCPEVECGFPVPRESFRLVGNPAHPRLVTRKTQKDCTDIMKRWAAQRLHELEKENLDGFIFKSKSPSSGMERVKVYPENGGPPLKKGSGIFAGLFMEHFPLLPVEEDGRLHDEGLRENFIERLFVMQRWQHMQEKASTRGGLVAFHTQHKMLIMAHSPQHYRTLGKLTANMKGRRLKSVQDEYLAILMPALQRRATPRKNTNVLHHIMGYFKQQLSSDEKQELIEVIESYHRGNIPLIVPVTLINHYTRKYRQPYLCSQYYLHPHPIELQLRNHV
jgi:uncharacterized protein YbgA (DUF1722 family)/uncharacterized protein YbbK (DUF523 family)